jgi:ABC-type nickel/cobalt efflux system permease component RcnA
MNPEQFGWLYLPSAILLGALHGLEPGHSKTMMASFIIAIRGTICQAVLLGLCATISHTAIIWIIAALGLHYSNRINAETMEPVLQIISGFTILAMAFWMFRTTFVLCFSIGLAITLVSFGSIAAWSVQHASRRFTRFDRWARRAPYLSTLLLLVIAVILLARGFAHLPHAA